MQALHLRTAEPELVELIDDWIERHAVDCVNYLDALQAAAYVGVAEAPHVAFIGWRDLSASDAELCHVIAARWPRTVLIVYGAARGEVPDVAHAYARTTMQLRLLLDASPAALNAHLLSPPDQQPADDREQWSTADAKPDFLVLGTEALFADVRRTAPLASVVLAEASPVGVAQAARLRPSVIVTPASDPRETERRVLALRRAAPDSLRVVLGPPESATDATIPADALIRSIEELPGAVRGARGRRRSNAPALRLGALCDLLYALRRGRRAALDACAAMLAGWLDAEGVEIELDGVRSRIGVISGPMLEETIWRSGLSVGSMRVARPGGEAYSAADAARLRAAAEVVLLAEAEARQRAALRETSWTDQLSGLRNRRYFEHRLRELLVEAQTRESRVTVFLFDIDDFKTYNDTYGHDIGDQVIREIAILLRRCSRPDDVVTRYGGDEFGVIFWDAEEPREPGSQHPRQIEPVARRFCEALAKHRFECLGPHAPGRVTISGGMAWYPQHGATVDTLVRAADHALLDAKQAGKNSIALAGKPNTLS